VRLVSVRPAVLALIAVAAMAAVLAGGAGADSAKAQICGTPPDQAEGAYFYVRAVNMTCDRAQKVAGKVTDDFCERTGDCPAGPNDPFVRGHEHYRGWECKLVVAYEFLRVRCERNDHRFHYETGA